MKIRRLSEMKKGWFVGGFEPTIVKTNDVEVAVKSYKKGDAEDKHYHKISTEITVIVSGKVKMNNIVYNQGDIITIEPNESSDFEALEDAVCTVVKHPGASNDKYLGEAK
jgi:quercetin dioxygenase-like cupin family protein